VNIKIQRRKKEEEEEKKLAIISKDFDSISPKMSN
jgi:hypothetical protein